MQEGSATAGGKGAQCSLCGRVRLARAGTLWPQRDKARGILRRRGEEASRVLSARPQA